MKNWFNSFFFSFVLDPKKTILSEPKEYIHLGYDKTKFIHYAVCIFLAGRHYWWFRFRWSRIFGWSTWNLPWNTIWYVQWMICFKVEPTSLVSYLSITNTWFFFTLSFWILIFHSICMSHRTTFMYNISFFFG